MVSGFIGMDIAVMSGNRVDRARRHPDRPRQGFRVQVRGAFRHRRADTIHRQLGHHRLSGRYCRSSERGQLHGGFPSLLHRHRGGAARLHIGRDEHRSFRAFPGHRPHAGSGSGHYQTISLNMGPLTIAPFTNLAAVSAALSFQILSLNFIMILVENATAT